MFRLALPADGAQPAKRALRRHQSGRGWLRLNEDRFPRSGRRVVHICWENFCNIVACKVFGPIFASLLKMMRRFRPYIAWIMLLATFAIALPRTWVHECCNDAEATHAQGDAGDHDHIDHANCPVCEYAPTSPFTAVYQPRLLAPVAFMARAPRLVLCCATPDVDRNFLRGPPCA